MSNNSVLINMNNSQRTLGIMAILYGLSRNHKPQQQTIPSGGFNKQPSTRQKRIQKLEKKIKRYNTAYRQGEPLITDMAYDQLVERLRAMDPQNAWFGEPEPEPLSGRKVFHQVPMLSTKKAYSRRKVQEYLNLLNKTAKKLGLPHATIYITPKLDGVALDWSDGVLSTRGEKGYGNEITPLVEQGLVFVPPSIKDEEFRGELVITREYFNKNLADKSGQPRDFVSGISRTRSALKGDKLAAMQAGAIHAVSFDGFTNDQRKVFPLTDENVNLILASLEAIHADLINSVDYDCDGIVMTCVDREVQKKLGREGDYWKYMLAFKVRGEVVPTTVRKIKWSIGRYGNFTPVLNFDKVYFNRVKYADGTVTGGISRSGASGFNFRMCMSRGMGIGAKIEVLMSGEVIPYVSKVVEESTDIPYPEECPYCETKTIVKGVNLQCPNTTCRGRLTAKLSLFTSTLEIKGFGEKRLLKLVDKGYKTINSLFNMSLEDFRKTFGPKYGKNLFYALQRTLSKKIPKEDLIRALGIETIGTSKSEALVRAIPDLDVRRLNEIKRQELLSIRGIGPAKAKAIKQSLRQMWPQIEPLLRYDFQLVEPQLQVPLAQDHKRIMFSGRMKYGLKQIQRYTREKGHVVATDFQDGVDILVRGPKAGEYRVNRAKRDGIEIISEKEFFKRFK